MGHGRLKPGGWLRGKLRDLGPLPKAPPPQPSRDPDPGATIARLTAERDAALAVAREYVPRCRDCGAAAVGEASCFNIEADGSEEIEAYCEDHAGDCDVRFNVAPAIRLLGPLLERVK